MRIERGRKLIDGSRMQTRLILAESPRLRMQGSRWNICERVPGKNNCENEQHWRSSAHGKIVARFSIDPVSHVTKKTT